ncbi:Short-chain dehydrogenase/reductase sdr [uncultured Paludibacter sp.]|nr:Short-chain dehydrogenase/reductase sdr [uncultured Paludibacter sp.]
MKKAVVIGATSGIGKGLSRILVKNNYKVGIAGRRTNLLEELAAENPGLYLTKTLDVTLTDTIVQTLEELVSELGGLDLLVISSGVIKYNIDLDFAVEKMTIDTNVKGFTRIADWGFNFFKNQGYGHLVGITSVAGFRGWRNNPSYNASKSYQMNYLEGLRSLSNYLKLPITVTDVRPGYVDTAMVGKSYVFWVSTVEKVASQIYKGIHKKRKVVYVSQRWRFGAWLYKRLPNKVVENV